MHVRICFVTSDKQAVKRIIPTDFVMLRDNKRFLDILKFCVVFLEKNRDMILDKSVSLFSTPCLQISSSVHSAQVYAFCKHILCASSWNKHSADRGNIASYDYS